MQYDISEMNRLNGKPPKGMRWNSLGVATSIAPYEAEWISMTEMARLMSLKMGSLGSLSVDMTNGGVKSKSRSMKADNCQGAGKLWLKKDIELLVKIRQAARLSPAASIRVFTAVRAGYLEWAL